MPLKNRHRTDVKNRRSIPQQQTTTGVVEAVIFQQPNLSLYLKLQNLLNFFIDCMNNLTPAPYNHPDYANHLAQCITHIEETFSKCSTQISNELRQLLSDFLEDARDFNNLVTIISSSTLSNNLPDQTSTMQLIAKASHLQWLSVCIFQEMKVAFRH